eukprot:jgi/Mesvir1/17454/Mv08728-RA.1
MARAMRPVHNIYQFMRDLPRGTPPSRQKMDVAAVKQNLSKLEELDTRQSAFQALTDVLAALNERDVGAFLSCLYFDSRHRGPTTPQAVTLLGSCARQHPSWTSPHAPKIMDTVIRVLRSSGSNAQMQAACADVCHNLASAGLSLSEENLSTQPLIELVCESLVTVLNDVLEPLASGSALCLRKVVEEEPWSYLSPTSKSVSDVVNASVSIFCDQKKPCTLNHMHLVAALMQKTPEGVFAGMGFNCVRAALAILLESNVWQERQAAIQVVREALIRLPTEHPEALPLLNQAKSLDKNAEVRRAAAAAVKAITGKDAQATTASAASSLPATSLITVSGRPAPTTTLTGGQTPSSLITPEGGLGAAARPQPLMSANARYEGQRGSPDSATATSAEGRYLCEDEQLLASVTTPEAAAAAKPMAAKPSLVDPGVSMQPINPVPSSVNPSSEPPAQAAASNPSLLTLNLAHAPLSHPAALAATQIPSRIPRLASNAGRPATAPAAVSVAPPAADAPTSLYERLSRAATLPPAGPQTATGATNAEEHVLASPYQPASATPNQPATADESCGSNWGTPAAMAMRAGPEGYEGGGAHGMHGGATTPLGGGSATPLGPHHRAAASSAVRPQAAPRTMAISYGTQMGAQSPAPMAASEHREVARVDVAAEGELGGVASIMVAVDVRPPAPRTPDLQVHATLTTNVVPVHAALAPNAAVGTVGTPLVSAGVASSSPNAPVSGSGAAVDEGEGVRGGVIVDDKDGVATDDGGGGSRLRQPQAFRLGRQQQAEGQVEERPLHARGLAPLIAHALGPESTPELVQKLSRPASMLSDATDDNGRLLSAGNPATNQNANQSASQNVNNSHGLVGNGIGRGGRSPLAATQAGVAATLIRDLARECEAVAGLGGADISNVVAAQAHAAGAARRGSADKENDPAFGGGVGAGGGARQPLERRRNGAGEGAAAGGAQRMPGLVACDVSVDSTKGFVSRDVAVCDVFVSGVCVGYVIVMLGRKRWSLSDGCQFARFFHAAFCVSGHRFRALYVLFLFIWVAGS